MALIKCPECGKEISDKALACIHCGFPLSLIDNESKTQTVEGSVTAKKEESVPDEKGYSMELLNYGIKKVQVASILKRTLNLKDVEALELVANTPCYLFRGKQEHIILPIIQKLDSLPVEYKLYLDGKLKRHKNESEINKPESISSTHRTGSYIKKIKCPNCSSFIAETSRVCPECGYDAISSYLLQLEREKQSKYIDYTYNHNVNSIDNNMKNVPKCPTCQSTDIKKVSTASKVGSVFIWGLLSQKVKKQWHCNNCGYEW